MVTVWRYILDNKVYNGFKQGQITPNIEHLTLLKHIYLVAQCSKIIDTVLFLDHIFYDFSAFDQFPTSNVRMSEGTFCHAGVHIILYSEKKTRGLKFRIYEKEETYYLCCNIKCVAQGICTFVFA